MSQQRGVGMMPPTGYVNPSTPYGPPPGVGVGGMGGVPAGAPMGGVPQYNMPPQGGIAPPNMMPRAPVPPMQPLPTPGVQPMGMPVPMPTLAPAIGAPPPGPPQVFETFLLHISVIY
jgi:hypothetical protein